MAACTCLGVARVSPEGAGASGPGPQAACCWVTLLPRLAPPSPSPAPPTGRSWCSEGQSKGNPAAAAAGRVPGVPGLAAFTGEVAVSSRKPVVTPGDRFRTLGNGNSAALCGLT